MIEANSELWYLKIAFFLSLQFDDYKDIFDFDFCSVFIIKNSNFSLVSVLFKEGLTKA